LNVGRTQTGGLDFDVATRHATPLGTLSSRLQASTIVHQRVQRYPGALGESGIGQDLGGGATLRWRGRWSSTLQPTRAWSHTLTLAFQSGYREAEQTVLVLDAQGQPTGETAKLRLKVPAFLTWDWLSTWQASGGLRLNLGVLNVLDTPPPLSINTGGGGKANMVGYDERYFDPRGRTVVLEARLSF
jgi:iron complex outermembrane receptor protein